MRREYGMHLGYVTDRNDPEQLHRVRLCVPGIVEPQSGWALPLGVGGAKDWGAFAVPPLGAEVAVWFRCGDIEAPHYMPAHWGKPNGQSEVPPEARRTPPDNVVLSTPTFCVEFDGDQRFVISNRRTGDRIEWDESGVRIKTLGSIDLDATLVTIKGRQVRPIAAPI